MKEEFYLDAHCHLFTLEYPLKEARHMLHDMLSGAYPKEIPADLIRKRQTKAKFIKNPLIRLLIQFYETISAASGSEEGNLDLLQSRASDAMKENKWIVVPLMMDIYYMYADPVQAGDWPKEPKEGTRVDDAEFQGDWNEILDDLIEYITSKKRDDTLKKGMEPDHFLEAIEAERDIGTTKRFVAGLESAKVSFERKGRTEGFYFHLNNLEKLEGRRKGELYPFIAVDPRRPGMIDKIIGGNYITNDGPFYGVKLYPRLGYHPKCKPLDALYRYCNDQKIPITFHCGEGGFPPFPGWEHGHFGHPKHFEQILIDHPNLKINFAHLGSPIRGCDWSKKIIDLMENYENVYSDLSCYTNEKDLDKAKELWNDKTNTILKSRLMFGTDFDVMYFTDKIDLKEYFDNFKSIFDGENDLKLLMHVNPTKFFEDIVARS